MKMKIKQINILALLTVFCCFTALAQKPYPTPKSKPKTTSKVSVQKVATPAIADGNKTKAEEYLKQGQKYWKDIEISKTIEAYTKALELYPNYAEALRERGIVFYMTRKNDSAAGDFDAFLKIEPRNPIILYYRGLNYTALAERIEENDIDRSSAKTLAQKALDDFNLAIQIDSNKAEYFRGRGKLLYNYDNYEKALADFETSVKLEPNSHIAYGYLGMTKFYLGKGGIRELDKAIEIYPSYAESYYNLAKYMEGNNMPDGAFGNYELAIERDPSNGKYYTARGILYFRMEKYELALAELNQAIAKDKTYGMAYFNRAMLYKAVPELLNEDLILRSRLQYQKRLEDLTSAIKYKPNFADSYVERGNIVFSSIGSKESPEAKAKLDSVLADFQMGVKLDPNSAGAYNGRASVYDDLGKKDLALADYTKAIELDPNLVTAYMGRMGIYCEMGKKELSIADEKKIKALGYAALNPCSFGK